MNNKFPYSPRVKFIVKDSAGYLVYDGKEIGYHIYGIKMFVESTKAAEMREDIILKNNPNKMVVTKVDTNEVIVVYKCLLRKPTTVEYMKIKRNNYS